MIKRFTNCLSLFAGCVILFSMVVNFNKDLWSHFAWNVHWASPFMTLFYNLNSYNGFNPFVDIPKLVMVLFVPILTINYICFNKITVWHK